MDKNFVYTCVECRLSDTIDKDTAQCKQGKYSDQLIINKTQTALEVGSYHYPLPGSFMFHLMTMNKSSESNSTSKYNFKYETGIEIS